MKNEYLEGSNSFYCCPFFIVFCHEVTTRSENIAAMKKKKVQRPKSQQEAMLRRLRFAKHSNAIEGLHLTEEQENVFTELILNGFEPDEVEKKLDELISQIGDA